MLHLMQAEHSAPEASAFLREVGQCVHAGASGDLICLYKTPTSRGPVAVAMQRGSMCTAAVLGLPSFDNCIHMHTQWHAS